MDGDEIISGDEAKEGGCLVFLLNNNHLFQSLLLRHTWSRIECGTPSYAACVKKRVVLMNVDKPQGFAVGMIK